MHAIAAKAICFKEALSEDSKTYQQQVVKNAKAMSEVIMSRGYDIVSGGTENHLMLISLIKQEITGKEADKWLGDAFITVNKNAVPKRSEITICDLRGTHWHACSYDTWFW